MKKSINFFSWFYQNWFTVLCTGLLLFIAFYPKIPLLELIPGYIVRVRLEDFFLTGVLLVFGVLLVKKKVTIQTPITRILIGYVVVGILSMLSALFVVKSVPLDSFVHVEKMFLHFLRRLEYFTLFFLFYNAVKSFRHVRMVLIAAMIMIVGISVYGFGQKYLYWPVYSTMNREFSKGVKLVLTEHARVPSTFGGHYDMSAFIMFLLALTLSLVFLSRSKMEKACLVIVFVMGFWLLILGSSRSSFLAYLLAIGIVVLLIGVYKQSLWWVISRGFVVFSFSMVVMLTLGDLSSRFTQLGIVQQVNNYLAALQKPLAKQPDNSIKVEPITDTDQLPTPAQTSPPSTPTGKPLPGDVYTDIPDLKNVISTEDGKTVIGVIQVPRTYSACTEQYGLSACIRYDTLWPRAINGFLRNPLVGSGPSTLTKAVRNEFTEAESTDNDFLRTLGEVGILGAITFYGPIFIFIWKAVEVLSKKPRGLVAAILIGLIAGTLGMFINALYIDVFAASKVAFMYWAMIGVGFATIRLTYEKKK
ncbi:MAG: O-antigen ligase family protein [Candidatus Woesebacteria bacterium]